MGCGATLFAGEHEADTYEFQRSLPVRCMAVFVGKIAFALVSTAAMLGSHGVACRVLDALSGCDASIRRAGDAMIWATFGFFGLEMFLWAVFFSLLSKRVLVAAILGVAAASISAHIAAASIAMAVVMETVCEAMPWRAAIAAMVALGRRLARGPLVPRKAADGLAVVGRRSSPKRWRGRRVFRSLSRPQRLAILGRLVWQHWRQSRG